jgi:hypothetical protein
MGDIQFLKGDRETRVGPETRKDSPHAFKEVRKGGKEKGSWRKEEGRRGGRIGSKEEEEGRP